ncbi:hypothetical protein J2X83_001133 [Brevibacillus nitrificans]|nr:hypothetical protein [Brevibacillus nitrificans]
MNTRLIVVSRILNLVEPSIRDGNKNAKDHFLTILKLFTVMFLILHYSRLYLQFVRHWYTYVWLTLSCRSYQLKNQKAVAVIYDKTGKQLIYLLWKRQSFF